MLKTHIRSGEIGHWSALESLAMTLPYIAVEFLHCVPGVAQQIKCFHYRLVHQCHLLHAIHPFTANFV